MSSQSACNVFEELEYPPKAPVALSLDVSKCKHVTQRPCEPITEALFQSFLDVDGRLVDEHRLRQTVFKGNHPIMNP